MKDDEELVMLGEYETEIEANMVKGVLETNGVQAMLTNEIMSSLLPLSPVGIGLVRVMVFKSDLALARKILDSQPIGDDIKQ
jgi:hypothetical protein